MVTLPQIRVYIQAQPFRPFRLQMASGKTFDVRHPEMVRPRKNYPMVFYFVPDDAYVIDHWETISLMLIESVSHLDAAVEA